MFVTLSHTHCVTLGLRDLFIMFIITFMFAFLITISLLLRKNRQEPSVLIDSFAKRACIKVTIAMYQTYIRDLRYNEFRPVLIAN